MDYDNIIPQNKDRPLLNEILVKTTNLVGMIADQNFHDICFTVFYPTAAATAYIPKAEVFQGRTFGYDRR